MDDPLAFFLTWTCYGTWLPGDERGFVRRGWSGIQAGDPGDRDIATRAMSEDAVALTSAMRDAVATAVRDHAVFRDRPLLALNVRTNHVHVVVRSRSHGPTEVMRQFKAYATRALRDFDPARERWWTKGGSKRYLNSEEDVEAAVVYVRDAQ